MSVHLIEAFESTFPRPTNRSVDFIKLLIVNDPEFSALTKMLMNCHYYILVRSKFETPPKEMLKAMFKILKDIKIVEKEEEMMTWCNFTGGANTNSVKSRDNSTLWLRWEKIMRDIKNTICKQLLENAINPSIHLLKQSFVDKTEYLILLKKQLKTGQIISPEVLSRGVTEWQGLWRMSNAAISSTYLEIGQRRIERTENYRGCFERLSDYINEIKETYDEIMTMQNKQISDFLEANNDMKLILENKHNERWLQTWTQFTFGILDQIVDDLSIVDTSLTEEDNIYEKNKKKIIQMEEDYELLLTFAALVSHKKIDNTSEKNEEIIIPIYNKEKKQMRTREEYIEEMRCDFIVWIQKV
jgi:hypothetical protein